MIQTVLSFLLGFLVAAALALAAAPILWRRAGVLMRRRIEASMPLTREELQAEIDAVKAEHAMSIRRLEMKTEAARKKAAQDLVEINRQREEVKRLQEECAARDQNIARLEAERTELSARLAQREGEIEALSLRLAETERSLKDRMGEVEELSRLYEESSLTSSSRQIDLVARESEIERLNDTITALRGQRKEADRAMREAMAGKTQAEEALRVERKRSSELERKLERMMSNLSTRDERLERREKEIARLKQKIRDGVPANDGALASRLAEAEEAKARLEMKVADLSLQISSLLAQEAHADNAEAPVPKNGEVERLQSRLATLIRENKRLRTESAAGGTAQAGEGDEALREQISSLAAEVVSMAAALEGPGSPIEKALADARPSPLEGERTHPPSLAERVRALRQGSTIQG